MDLRFISFLLLALIFSFTEAGNSHWRGNRPLHMSAGSLQDTIDKMWEADEDRFDSSSMQMNWGKRLKRDQVKDLSSDPLFTYVDESLLEKPIYAELIKIYEQNLFRPPVCAEEPQMSEQRRNKLNGFMSLVFRSEVFKIAYNYMDAQNKTGGDFNAFCDKLFDYWFDTYSRCCRSDDDSEENECILGSSGWEHVFSGEYNQKKSQKIVEGHHNWVRYYLQEKAGEINYHGYFGHMEGLVGTIQYTWNGFLKKVGGFFISTSPAFDFSMFSLCLMTHKGDEACHFRLLGEDMSITSYTGTCGGPVFRYHGGMCVETSYPVIKLNSF